MGFNKKATSPAVASLASQVLQDPHSLKIAKEMAGSALSQANPAHQTSAEMETKASNVLQSNKYSEATQTLAASVLAQSSKSR